MLLFFYCDILNNLFYLANNILRTSFNRLERGDNGVEGGDTITLLMSIFPTHFIL